ncbi:MAG TPA: bifunctional riboflavin kinase/FAD synthetase [Burkholderiales bacterium]|nr:bifunctional riboflavin kinase/FAD synthetase [Burkholderiales bacterium]
MLICRGIPGKARASVALSIGNFDGIHVGHRAMLTRLAQSAKSRGLVSCVLTFEPHPREFFAPLSAPARLSNLREKLEAFASLGVERTHICRFNRNFSSMTAQEFIERVVCGGLNAKWLLVGEDFRFGSKRAGDLALLQKAGQKLDFEVTVMPSIMLKGQRISSTMVRDALAEGDLERASELLGKPYSMSGRVVHGDKTGRRIGFPTANIKIKHARPPLGGIFAVEVSGISECPLKGVASLGVRPTIMDNGAPVLEVHVFDFNREIYGQHVRVEFVHKLREEEKYPDLKTLTQQISLDVEKAKEYFFAAAAQRQ